MTVLLCILNDAKLQLSFKRMARLQAEATERPSESNGQQADIFLQEPSLVIFLSPQMAIDNKAPLGPD